MLKRKLDPRRLDVVDMAKQAAVIEADWPLSEMPRLAEAIRPGTDLRPLVHVHAQGEWVELAGGAGEIWMHLQVRAQLGMTCQRCLEEVKEAVEVECSIRFVGDEAAAESLDEELEEDVLSLSPPPDLMALAEDELILALPLVPKHDVCPHLPPPVPESVSELPTRPNPFAALAGLKKRN